MKTLFAYSSDKSSQCRLILSRGRDEKPTW